MASRDPLLYGYIESWLEGANLNKPVTEYNIIVNCLQFLNMMLLLDIFIPFLYSHSNTCTFYYCIIVAGAVCCRVKTVLGYQPQELLGKVAFEYYHPEDQTHMKDTFEQGQFSFFVSLLICHCSFTFIYSSHFYGMYFWEQVDEGSVMTNFWQMIHMVLL